MKASSLLAGLSMALSVVLAGTSALAQPDYPAKPVKVVVPYDAGGPVDIMGRIVLDKLSERLGQQFLIEHRPGAATRIGTENVVRAEPDGYTLLYTAVSAIITLALTEQENLGFDVSEDLEPVASTHTGAYVLYVNPTLGINSAADLITKAKEQPGAFSYSSTGVGAHTYFTSELFKHLSGTDILHVPYKGTNPATQAVVSNEVSMVFGSPVLHKQYGETGQLKALGVTSLEPLSQFPDLKPLNETVLGFSSTYSFTFFAPKGTPEEIAEKLNAEIGEVLKLDDVREKILAIGEPDGSSRQKVREDIARELNTMTNLVKEVGLKLTE